MSLKFSKLTKEQERTLIIKNLAANLAAIAHDKARLIAALEWTTLDEIDEVLLLLSEENALKVRSLKESLPGATGR